MRYECVVAAGLHGGCQWAIVGYTQKIYIAKIFWRGVGELCHSKFLLPSTSSLDEFGMCRERPDI